MSFPVVHWHFSNSPRMSIKCSNAEQQSPQAVSEMFSTSEPDGRFKYWWAGGFSVVILTPLGWSLLGSELKSARDWGRINILICGPRDLLSAASDRHPIAWPGESRRHQSSGPTSDCGRVIQMPAAAKCSVHLRVKGSHRDASWLHISFLTVVTWKGKQLHFAGTRAPSAPRKQNRKWCHYPLNSAHTVLYLKSERSHMNFFF